MTWPLWPRGHAWKFNLTCKSQHKPVSDNLCEDVNNKKVDASESNTIDVKSSAIYFDLQGSFSAFLCSASKQFGLNKRRGAMKRWCKGSFISISSRFGVVSKELVCKFWSFFVIQYVVSVLSSLPHFELICFKSTNVNMFE